MCRSWALSLQSTNFTPCSLVVSQFRGLVLLMSSSLAVFGSRELLEGEVELTFEVLKSQT